MANGEIKEYAYPRPPRKPEPSPTKERDERLTRIEATLSRIAKDIAALKAGARQ